MSSLATNAVHRCWSSALDELATLESACDSAGMCARALVYRFGQQLRLEGP